MSGNNITGVFNAPKLVKTIGGCVFAFMMASTGSHSFAQGMDEREGAQSTPK